ncbi:MAG: hypothetical protein ACR2PF_12095 [Rhizobiaceae bacterium]
MPRRNKLALAFEQLAEADLATTHAHRNNALGNVGNVPASFNPDHVPFEFDQALALQGSIKGKLAALG